MLRRFTEIVGALGLISIYYLAAAAIFIVPFALVGLVIFLAIASTTF